MTLEGLDAAAAFRSLVLHVAARCGELPELDGLVQTSGDKVPAVRRERHAVYAVLVAIRSLKALHRTALSEIPDANALVQGASSNIFGVWGYGYCGHTILNGKHCEGCAVLNIPKPDGAVSTSGSNCTAVARKV